MYRQNTPDLSIPTRRADAIYNAITCAAIGIGLALALVAWWSA